MTPSRAAALRVGDQCRLLADSGRSGNESSNGAVVVSTRAQYAVLMKTMVPLQIRVEPELLAEIESVLRPGETLTEFVDETLRAAMTYRRMQVDFRARAAAASAEYHRTGVTVPVDAVLDKLQAKLDAKRKELTR